VGRAGLILCVPRCSIRGDGRCRRRRLCRCTAAEKVVVCTTHAARAFGELRPGRIGRLASTSFFLVGLGTEDRHRSESIVALAALVAGLAGEKLAAELLGSRVDVGEDLLLLLGRGTAKWASVQGWAVVYKQTEHTPHRYFGGRGSRTEQVKRSIARKATEKRRAEAQLTRARGREMGVMGQRVRRRRR